MVSPTSFNSALPLVMHLDLNSCFASVEQQANPLLRHKPVAVVHSDAPYGCILAPSVEAKLWGVKTGMSLKEGRELCPILIPRLADPPKYREVHHRFAELLHTYSDHLVAKSIDEFCLLLRPSYAQGVPDLPRLTHEIKARIKREIGDYLRISVGVSTNQNLAKLASGLHKPDGFDLIDHTNYLDVYQTIKLQDFCGINVRNEARLHRVGIFTPLQFYAASRQTLKTAFQSVLGDYWYARLRGYEVDDITFQTRSFGQSYVLPHPMNKGEWYPIMAKLVSKAGRRLRKEGFLASGAHLSLRYSDHSHYRLGHKTQAVLYNDVDLISAVNSLCPPTDKPVKKVAITLFGITREDRQESLLIDKVKEKRLVTALDELNSRYGEYTISYASMFGTKDHARDAIAFGKV